MGGSGNESSGGGSGNGTSTGGSSNGGSSNGGSSNGGSSNGGSSNGGSSNGGSGGSSTSSSGDCITDPTQDAVILGDSYVTGFGTPALQPALAAIITDIGKYPNYAGAGCSMISGGACTGLYGNVPQQATTAMSQHANAKFAIMDGGGNDILICDQVKYPSCNTLCGAAGSSKQKVCTDIVAGAIAGATDLMKQTANSGMRDVIYFFYPHIPDAGGGYNEILDYAEPLAKAACDNAVNTTGGKLRCHFVDMVQPFLQAFGPPTASQFEPLGIHPLAPGVNLMAKTITDEMTKDCLGQSSGCCVSP
jgi:hypothetical protein